MGRLSDWNFRGNATIQAGDCNNSKSRLHSLRLLLLVWAATVFLRSYFPCVWEAV